MSTYHDPKSQGSGSISFHEKKTKSIQERTDPKKDKTRIKSSLYFCYMSEIELQGLLDRTNLLDDDPEAMDMIIIDGVRISKFDIRAPSK